MEIVAIEREVKNQTKVGWTEGSRVEGKTLQDRYTGLRGDDAVKGLQGSEWTKS